MSQTSKKISICISPKIKGYEDVEFEVRGDLVKIMDRSTGVVSTYWTWDSYEIYHQDIRLTDLLLDSVRDKVLNYAEDASEYEKLHGFTKPKVEET